MNRQKSTKGEVTLAVTLLSVAVVAMGIVLGTQQIVREQAFRIFGFAVGEKVRLVSPLTITDRGDYYLLSSTVCFNGLSVPSNPGRYWIHTEKKANGIYAASSVEYIAPQTKIPYCGNSNGKEWDFTMKVLKVDAPYLCRSGLLFTSSSAFAVNEKIDLAGNNLSFICQNITPTQAACPINLTAYLKEKQSDGTLREMTDIVPSSIKWYAMNDKQIARHGTNYSPKNASENWYGFGQPQYGNIGGKFVVAIPNVTWPIKAASDDDQGRPYVYQKGDKACVRLTFDKDLYQIDSADPGPATIGATIKDTNVKDEICNLPLDCNMNYTYGWTMKKKTAPTATPTQTTTPRPTTTTIPTGSTTPTGSACTISGPGWVDSDRSRIKTSNWFTTHKYGDCADTAGGFWPSLQADCLVSDQLNGPTAGDTSRVAEPSNLYYKHLTPGDILDLVPTQGLINNQTLADDTIKDRIRKLIIDEIKKNPRRFSSISLDSVAIGLEGGRDGTKVRSLSLWVHPTVERLITESITIRERALLLYQPFIEGAVNQSVSLDDVTELYTAALNKCGSNAIGGDKSGLGTAKRFGDYTAIVQDWSTSTTDDDIFSEFRDCNIHIVKTDLTCRPTPPAGGSTTSTPVPTGSGGSGSGSGGSSAACVLRDTDHAERCRPKSVRVDLQSKTKARVSWDRMTDPACEFDVYNLDIVDVTEDGTIVCHRSNIPKDENGTEPKVSVGCDVVKDRDGVKKQISEFKPGYTYTTNIYLLKNDPSGCYSKGGHADLPPRSTNATSAPEPTTVQPTTDTSCPWYKRNAQGQCDEACCDPNNGATCPKSGEKCTTANGNCAGSGFSCTVATVPQPNPVPPPALPPTRGNDGRAIGSGFCSPENLYKYLKDAPISEEEKRKRARNASCICQEESTSNPSSEPRLSCFSSASNQYVVGLFQINLLAHPGKCPNGKNGLVKPGDRCSIIDPDAFAACVKHLKDPDKNIKAMMEITGNMSVWCKGRFYTPVLNKYLCSPFTTADKCGLGI